MKTNLLRAIKYMAFETFGANECKFALALHQQNKSLPEGSSRRTAYAFKALKVFNWLYSLNKVISIQDKIALEKEQVFDEHLLSLMLNSIYDLPDVEVDPTSPHRINVLVPAFTVNTISAGFFGVFNVALFIADLGFKVRLVMFDNFYYIEEEFKKSLSKFPSMEHLFDVLEVEYIGAREKPLKVSPNDNCVATVWYSAYFAKKIAQVTGNKPFLYLIQDYEAVFYPCNSSYSVAKESYNFDYHALCSSSSLLAFVRQQRIISDSRKSISFNNACSFSIFNKDEFLLNKSATKKKFVFYSRPSVNRNMFELAALALIQAYKQGAFNEGDWEFYGMGIGNAVVRLNESMQVEQLPRMSLAEYENITKTFDLCLTLMASPHPSLIPMDLAASGAVVVTNTFETKTPEYLLDISTNIIASAPTLESLVDAIFDAVKRVDDLEARYAGASVKWPTSWSETWKNEHKEFIREIFS